MKFHRVLLFTTIQMDITPVGEDLHVLLTSEYTPYIGCTTYARYTGDGETPETELTVLCGDEDPERFFTIYVADQLSRQSGKNVLCTGGIFVDDPDPQQTAKLYENLDEMIRDWTTFLTD